VKGGGEGKRRKRRGEERRGRRGGEGLHHGGWGMDAPACWSNSITPLELMKVTD